MNNIGMVVILALLLSCVSISEGQSQGKQQKKSEIEETSSIEKTALLNFKKSIRDPTGALKKWNKSTDPCKDIWPGIECSSTGRVQSINLPNFKLYGKLPNFTELMSLRSIKLPNNSFMGSLPEEWRLLSSLQTIDLSGNRISGNLPESWSDLPSLAYLYLTGNQLTGKLPAAWWLGNFEVLAMAENHLEGPLPNNWANMENIKVLDLGSNHLSGSLPHNWGGLSKLRVLRLENNELFGSLPEKWSEMESLIDLRLGFNYLVGALPPKWSFLVEAINMLLNDNNLGGFVPEEWSLLSKTCRIDLSNNPFICSLPPKGSILAKNTGSGLILRDTNSGQCPSPSSMDTQALLQFKAELVTEMEGEVLEDWQWKDSSACEDQWTGIECHDDRVTVLDLSNFGLSGYLSQNLAQMSALETLKLDGNSFDGILPETWGHLAVLKHLNLSGNTIGGILPVEWETMTELEVVDVSSNLLVGELPERWSTLKKLKIIRGFNNTLDGQLPFSWSTMEGIKTIALQNNILSGALPNTWRSFKEVETIDLSVNELIGPVPDSWENMENLKALHLQGNDDLCGGLPSWLPSPSSQTRRALSAPCTDFVSESILLVNFKSDIRDPRNALDLWKAGSPPCLPSFETWPGIICDDGRVVSVDLTELQLEGRLPGLLSDLSMLRELHLGGNQFTGDLPSSWSELLGLQHLNVSSNRLSGRLPAEWSTLVALRTLDLSQNILKGEMPPEWSRMVKLSQLNVSQNSELCGGLPSDLTDMVDVVAANSTFFEGCDSGGGSSWALPVLSLVLAVFIFVSILIWITCFCCCCYHRKKQRVKLLEMMSRSLSKNRGIQNKEIPLSNMEEQQPSASDVTSRGERILRSPTRFPAGGDASYTSRAVHPYYPPISHRTRTSWSLGNEQRASSSKSIQPQRPRSTPYDNASIIRRSSGFGSVQNIPATTSYDTSFHRGPQQLHPSPIPGDKSGLGLCRTSMEPAATPLELQSNVLKVRSANHCVPLDPRKRASKIPRRPTPSVASSVLNGSSSYRSSDNRSIRSVSDRSTLFKGSTRASTPPSSSYRVHFVPSESEELTVPEETRPPSSIVNKQNNDWHYETTIQIPSNSSRGCPSPSNEMFRWLESCYQSGTFDLDDIPRELFGRAVHPTRSNQGPSLSTLQYRYPSLSHYRDDVTAQATWDSTGIDGISRNAEFHKGVAIVAGNEDRRGKKFPNHRRPTYNPNKSWGQVDSNGLPIFNYKTCSTVDDAEDECIPK